MKVVVTKKRSLLLAICFDQIAHAKTSAPITLDLESPLDFQVFQRQTKTCGKAIIDCILETAAQSALTNLEKLEA